MLALNLATPTSYIQQLGALVAPPSSAYTAPHANAACAAPESAFTFVPAAQAGAAASPVPFRGFPLPPLSLLEVPDASLVAQIADASPACSRLQQRRAWAQSAGWREGADGAEPAHEPMSADAAGAEHEGPAGRKPRVDGPEDAEIDDDDMTGGQQL